MTPCGLRASGDHRTPRECHRKQVEALEAARIYDDTGGAVLFLEAKEGSPEEE